MKIGTIGSFYTGKMGKSIENTHKNLGSEVKIR